LKINTKHGKTFFIFFFRHQKNWWQWSISLFEGIQVHSLDFASKKARVSWKSQPWETLSFFAPDSNYVCI
jgi:hypothetical protein